MGVTVIIANYNQLSALPLALKSLARQRELPVQVVVADDGSCDETCEWMDGLQESAYPFPLRYVTQRHIGYGLTVIENLAASHVRSGRILFTNADLVHSPDSVMAHGAMQSHEVAGGRVEDIPMPYSQSIRGYNLDDFNDFVSRFGGFEGGYSNFEFMQHNPPINIYGIWGGNFSVDAARFHGIHGFNEEYRGLYGGEEADLIHRLMASGVVPAWAYNSLAYHLSHPSRAYASVSYGNLKYRMEHLI